MELRRVEIERRDRGVFESERLHDPLAQELGERLTGDGLEEDPRHLVVEVAVPEVGARREVTTVRLGCRHEQAVGNDDVLAGEVAVHQVVRLGDLCGVAEQRDVVEDLEVVGLVVDAGRVFEQYPQR